MSPTAELVYFDASGYEWEVDPETAEITPVVNTSVDDLVFESNDCTGPARPGSRSRRAPPTPDR